MAYMECPRCEWKLVRAEDNGVECTNSDCNFPHSEKEEITCEITHDDNKMLLEFYSNTGRFGTEELLDDYVLTSEQLLDILQEWRDKSCEDDTYGL
jgi:hypothetical protein